jgi:hypothetical protein
VCLLCSRTVLKCPTCRAESIKKGTVDADYYTRACRTVRSVSCDGCRKLLSTRSLATHQQSCPHYLWRQLEELRLEKAHVDTQYRQATDASASLRLELDQTRQTLAYYIEVIKIHNLRIQQAAAALHQTAAVVQQGSS